MTDIPFLPVSFFKTHRVLNNEHDSVALLFESSGTTAETPARHYVHDAALYEQALLSGFAQFYGDPKQYTFLALLPHYLERGHSSLVHMAQRLMAHSGKPYNGFYLHDFDSLYHSLRKLEDAGEHTLLLGVTYALLDFAAAYPMPLRHTIVMETGGMKGRKKEMTRSEVHDMLKARWQLPAIHSEYGMTEMLSQAYAAPFSDAAKAGIFSSTRTMRALVRDINDPLDVRNSGSGCLNIIDLANIYSCSFLATDDLAMVHPDHTFEVLGRADHSALRGCSLMSV
jgi:hypothetical protein